MGVAGDNNNNNDDKNNSGDELVANAQEKITRRSRLHCTAHLLCLHPKRGGRMIG